MSDPCGIGGCEKPVKTKGMCGMHYSRMRRNGSPERLVRRDHASRFLRSFTRRGEDECWPWAGQVGKDGYGVFTADRKRYRAHRYAYELLVGPIPEGLTIDHVWAWGCSRRDCVNPAHLEPVTMRENVLRGGSPIAENAKKDRCAAGHEYETYRGGRYCKTCKSEHEKAKRRAAKI